MDPKTGSRVPVDEAVNLGWIDERTCERLKNLGRYSKSVVDLKTNLLVRGLDLCQNYTWY